MKSVFLFFLFHSCIWGHGFGYILFLCLTIVSKQFLLLSQYNNFLFDNFLLFFSPIPLRFSFSMLFLISSFLNSMISYLFIFLNSDVFRKIDHFTLLFAFFYPALCEFSHLADESSPFFSVSSSLSPA